MVWVQPGSIYNMMVISFKCFGRQDTLKDHVSLFVVDCTKREER